MREIRQTSRFKKDYKAAVKRGLPKDELRAIIEALANDEPLPEALLAPNVLGLVVAFARWPLRLGYPFVLKR